MTRLPRDPDVYVIGSGIGGLAAAVLLAKVFGKRVCVLEQHWKAGGQTHSFTRSGGRYEWDVGIHYVGSPQPGSVPHLVLRYLADDRLEWRPLADAYDLVRFRDRQLAYVTGKERLRDALCRQFPDEEAALDAYFADVQRVMAWTVVDRTRHIVPRPFAWLMHRLNRRATALTQQTTASYLRSRFRSQALRNLVSGQWGDYGLPPEASAFEIHALVTGSYFNGACYPVGGAARIAEVLIDELERHGGCCLTNTRVERIVSDGRRVTELELSHRPLSAHPTRRVVPAPMVISDAGAFNTYRRLLDRPCFEELERVNWRSSMLLLFFTTDCDPAELGFDATNYWLHDTGSEDPFQDASGSGAFLAFPSLKRGGVEAHCGEVICLADPADFARWQGTSWRRRGPDYLELKEEIASRMIELVGSFYPQLPPHITGHELATPLSLEFFTRHSAGNPYGVPATPERHHYLFCRPTTPFKNLFLAGQDVFCLGFMGALMGGVYGASISQGVNGLPRIAWTLWRNQRKARGGGA